MIESAESLELFFAEPNLVQRRRLLAILLLAGISTLLSVGCGDGSPFSMAPVGGKLSYKDGSLVKGDRIVITFIPQGIESQGKAAAGAARVEVDPATGTFGNATTRKMQDGVVVAKHKVVVNAFKTGPGGHSIPNKAIAADYESDQNTPLELEIPAGGDTNLDIKVEKPSRR
jgi:hypothetical protein